VRTLDTKQWDELRSLLTEDCTVSYGGGATEMRGADEVVAWLRSALDDDGVHTSHRVSSPEITLRTPTEAEATWALADVVVDLRYDITIRGASFYEDRYEKGEDRIWRIAHTGYRRIYEELEPRRGSEGPRLTASWWTTDGRSQLG